MNNKCNQDKDSEKPLKILKLNRRENKCIEQTAVSFSLDKSKKTKKFLSLYKSDLNTQLKSWELTPSKRLPHKKSIEKSINVKSFDQKLDFIKPKDLIAPISQITCFTEEEDLITDDLKNVKTGEDAISFFKKYGNYTPAKFFYCKNIPYNPRYFRPYDLIVVNKNEISGDHFVISSHGVVNVSLESINNFQTECCALDDWLIQSRNFDLIREIKFFKHYLAGKIFLLWREKHKKCKYLTNREILRNNLLFGQTVFVENITKINEFTYEMEKSNWLVMNDVKIIEIENLKNSQRDARIHAQKALGIIMNSIMKELWTVWKSVKNREVFRHEEIDIYGGKKNKSLFQQKKEEEEVKYNIMLKERHIWMSGSYIRLIYYIIIETLVTQLQKKIKDFFKELLAKKSKKFFVNIKYEENSIYLSPNNQEVISNIEIIIEETLSDLDKITKLNSHFNEIVDPHHISDFPQPKKIIKNSKFFIKILKKFKIKINQDFKEAQCSIEDYFEKIRLIYQFFIAWNFDQWKLKNHPLIEINQEIEKIKGWITSDIPNFMPFQLPVNGNSILFIDGKALRQNIVDTFVIIQKELKEYLYEMIMEKVSKTIYSLKSIQNKLKQDNQKLSEFANNIQFLQESLVQVEQAEGLKIEINKTAVVFHKERGAENALINEKLYELEKETISTKSFLQSANQDLFKNKKPMEKKLLIKIRALQNKVNQELAEKLSKGKLTKPDTNPNEALFELNRIEENLTKLTQKIEKYKKYEVILEIKLPEITELDLIWKKLKSWHQFWSLRKEWDNFFHELMYDNFLELKKDIGFVVNQFNKELEMVKTNQKNLEISTDVLTQDFSEKITKVTKIVPIVETLSIKSLQPRHWEKIFKSLPTGVEYIEGKQFCLYELLEWEIVAIADKLDLVAYDANSELDIETAITEIKSKWEQTVFTIIKYRDQKDRYCIGGVEEVYNQLEDHLSTIHLLWENRYCYEFKEKLEFWEIKLKNIKEVIEEWIACQELWSYFESIFSNREMQKQLPMETAKFNIVNYFWIDIMIATFRNPSVLDACEIPGILEKLLQNKKILEEIQKSLDGYLETKKLAFPRFYFLSNQEILEILSKMESPIQLNYYISKCFSSIKEIILEKEGETIQALSIISQEDEKVEFVSPLIIEGNIEHWLISIEEIIIKTMHDYIKKAQDTYPSENLARKEWVLNGKIPAQCILIGNQIIFTNSTSRALSHIDTNINDDALKDCYNSTDIKIADLISIINGKVTEIQRILVENLIIFEIHNRDVIGSLIGNYVKKVDDFNWEKQFKYYWDFYSDNCIIKQLAANFAYSNEYLGNTPRLVITPITDKCYLALTQALSTHNGGAIEGIQCSGKTETIKDLSKSLGIYCLFVNSTKNCSIYLLEKILLGCAVGGLWACFDEFNKISIEVLSIMAGYLSAVHFSIRNSKEKFLLSGKQFKINPKCGIFITVNGLNNFDLKIKSKINSSQNRNELPKCLKLYFRPCAIVEFDYFLICETVFKCKGFNKAKELAQKLIEIYESASKKLSKQSHYHFRISSIKSVLNAAGNLKYSHQYLSEETILARTIRDFNISKIVEEDLELFKTIIYSHFPQIIPPKNYAYLENIIRHLIEVKNYANLENFIHKIIQLHECIKSRQGVIVIGEAGSGKTTIYKILAEALNKLNEDENISYISLNPKSVSIQDLYGNINTDGIIGSLIKNYLQEENDNSKKWIIFDARLESSWSDQLNSVLDDNKILCLNNGERIAIKDSISFIFETDLLYNASPAIISRVSVVYIDEKNIKWEALIDCWERWLKGEVSHITDYIVETTRNYISSFIDLEFKRKFFVSKNHMVISFLNLFKSIFKKEKILKMRIDDAKKLANLYIIFSILWSFGGSLNEEDKRKFDRILKEKIRSINEKEYILELFEYKINEDTCEFVLWDEKTHEIACNSSQPFHSIFIHTSDYSKHHYLQENLLKSNKNVLILGETGIGKTKYAKDFLKGKEGFISAGFNCNRNFSTQAIINIIENKLRKPSQCLRKPPAGKKMVIFIDGLNLLPIEDFNSQSTFEFIRQAIEGGYYDINKYYFQSIEDVYFIANYTLMKSKQSEITKRFIRHFHVILQNSPSQKSIEKIFSLILHGYLDEYSNKNLSSLINTIIKATIELYYKIFNDFETTPGKNHYQFNFRNLYKVIQGIILVDYDKFIDNKYITILWAYECCREFKDRLNSIEDKTVFDKEIEKHIYSDFGCEIEKEQWSDAIFSNFMGEDEKDYVVTKIDENLTEKLKIVLERYNEITSSSLNIIFFKYAVEHLFRIHRILTRSRGHLLLIGLEGSGKKTFSKLAAFISGYKFHISKSGSQFQEELKLCLRTAGCKNEGLVLLYNDNETVSEKNLEDISSILNDDETYNLYSNLEIKEIINEVRQCFGKSNSHYSNDNVLDYFFQRCKENLHIILAISPAGDNWIRKMKQYPSIINCCTIDWYESWSHETMVSIAKFIFNENKNLFDFDIIPAELFPLIHFSLESLNKQDRKYYIPPSSYLDFLSYFISYSIKQKNILTENLLKFKNGLKKIDHLSEIAANLQKINSELSENFDLQQKEIEKLESEINQKKEELKPKEEIWRKADDDCNAMINTIKALREALEKAHEPALNRCSAANEKMLGLGKSDVYEIVSYSKPTQLVDHILKAICLMFDAKENWESSKSLLRGGYFLKICAYYDIDNISEDKLNRLEKYLDNPLMNIKAVKKSSRALAALLEWLIAISSYAKLIVTLKPQKVNLANQEDNLLIMQSELQQKQSSWWATQDEVINLENEYKLKIDENEEIKKSIESKDLKIKKIQNLYVNLGNEKIRWRDSQKLIEKDIESVSTNSVLCSAYIIYLGQFNALYRQKFINEWLKYLQDLQIPYAADFSIERFLSNSVEIKKTIAFGLPNDSSCIVNSIIINKCRKWPFIIDPQNIASNWIKNMHGETLKVMKISESDFLKIIKSCIRYGNSILLENTSVNLDYSIATLLDKEIISKNGQFLLKFDDEEISYYDDFRFYIICNKKNPHILPDICVKMTLIDFSLKSKIIENQLLDEIAKLEIQNYEKNKTKILDEVFTNKNYLEEIEEQILKTISEIDEENFDNDNFVEILSESKESAKEIGLKIKKLEDKLKNFEIEKERYRSIAKRVTMFYYIFLNFQSLNPIYLKLLELYHDMLEFMISNSEKNENMRQRAKTITKNVLSFILTEPFMKDKFIFLLFIFSKLLGKVKLANYHKLRHN
ncbi:unnamed protein product [Blepharisma stoltei]|uniref:AAA+ ATPase domain-containing protein n=1 Tax=Blepharisma stoltei TaxID=1481888 RepID=A0AAU9JUA4_9CILI|nr:unnamed protein product [Blepharisma stoltei]